LRKKRIIILIATALITITCTSKPKPLHSVEWGAWDAGMYSDERYNMTLWLFKTKWFEDKTKEDVIRDLPDRNIEHRIKRDSICYAVKFTNGFMERWNIDYIPQDLGILVIYFKNDTVVKAKYEERKNVKSNYRTRKTWERKNG